MQIFWSIWDKNFNFVRPAVQFFPLKSHIWCKKSYVFESGQNFRIFASPSKGLDTFLFEMSMKWMFTFKNFRNVYWQGKQHSALYLFESYTSSFLMIYPRRENRISVSIVVKKKYNVWKTEIWLLEHGNPNSWKCHKSFIKQWMV